MKASNTSSSQARPGRRLITPFLLGLFFLGIVAAVAVPIYWRYSSMIGGSAPQTVQQFAASTPGAQAQIAVEVSGMPSDSMLTGSLLQKNADGTYSRTAKIVSVKWRSAKIVMGSSSDVKVGAILQISGTLSTNDTLTAVQIVILTGFAQLK